MKTWVRRVSAAVMLTLTLLGVGATTASAEVTQGPKGAQASGVEVP